MALRVLGSLFGGLPWSCLSSLPMISAEMVLGPAARSEADALLGMVIVILISDLCMLSPLLAYTFLAAQRSRNSSFHVQDRNSLSAMASLSPLPSHVVCTTVYLGLFTRVFRSYSRLSRRRWEKHPVGGKDFGSAWLISSVSEVSVTIFTCSSRWSSWCRVILLSNMPMVLLLHWQLLVSLCLCLGRTHPVQLIRTSVLTSWW